MNTEYIEDGYVKISRRVFYSKTFSSLNAIQKLITIYLILMANHQDNQWWNHHEKKFINIKRGSFITSIESIKKKIKDRLVTTQKIRTLLNILKNMQFLTMETTNKYTLVTIIKYDLYQNGESYSNKQINELVTSKQQGDNKVITTNNNVKKEKNEKNVKKNTLSRTFLSDDPVYQLTIYLDGKIRENNTAVKKRDEKQIQSWCKDMDKLIRIDHAKSNDIKKVIDWVVEDDFWSPNILSAIKLRKHYSRFYKKVIDRGRSLEEKLKVDHRFDNLK